ncbi:uncharacterized protein BDZ99DRAFT_376536 [Mytilinidion resinicola]|uniref:Hydrophobin n=1 Tax=Mytilinidion resinicola TaxID=574789 RepID=A0A6A6Z6H1_9PEZI|nr:uncharacterized protein BDZ99DRAFT_376536 [Mytilinidion resinicola]KAF2816309.1 hypothetical protein BDZ99DRAFT_376536 [Mytilinidion resinicola]
MGGELTKRDICGGDTSPVCCQLDVEGVADLNCQSPGDVSTVAEFEDACAAKGLSAECCTLVAVSSFLGCLFSGWDQRADERVGHGWSCLLCCLGGV